MPSRLFNALLFSVVSPVILAACSSTAAPTPSTSSSGVTASQVATPSASAAAHKDHPKKEAPKADAEVGKPAPDFTLNDTEGKPVSLSSFKGKTVVLEWFNPECPYVVNAHTKGSLKDTAEKLTAKGVVWLGINSGAPGKQGAGPEKTKAGTAKFGMKHTVLIDQEGVVGRKYGATNTPHMYVISADGNLAYAGAIDNSPDGEGENPEGGKLINYVDQAVTELLSGKPVSTPKTRAYGCSVKYGS